METRWLTVPVCRAAFDSAGALYKHALKAIGLDTSHVTKEVAEVVWKALKGKRAQPRAMAADASAASRRNQMFPNADRLHKGYY